MHDLETLLDRLLDHEVDFVVVGGFAAVAHGVSLLTEDIDICCRFTQPNLLKLWYAVQDLEPVHRMTPNRIPLESAALAGGDVKNLYLDTTYGQLDCLSQIEGVGGFDDVLKHSVAISLGKRSCRILNLAALIRSKEALGRPRDQEAVLQLRAIQESQGE